jgi:hypothetical protein
MGEKVTGKFSMALGEGAKTTQAYEMCIRDGQSGKEIRFVLEPEEIARLVGKDPMNIMNEYFQILAARYGK